MMFTDIFIERPVLASVVSLLILVLGLRAAISLDVRQYPDTKNTVVTITTTYPGASSELIKGFITTPLQQAIAEADGIDYLTSSSRQGVSTIEVYTKLNYDPKDAVAEILAKVASQRNVLPREANDPVIDSRTGDTSSLMYIAFYSATMHPSQITDYLLRVVRPRLQAIPGVAKATLIGHKTFAMRIWLNPRKMAAFGVTANDVRRVLLSNNYLSGAGETMGEFVTIDLSATTDVTRVEDFDNLVVRVENGVLVRLSDVATTELGSEDYNSGGWYNGQTAVYIGIDPVPGSNPLDVAHGVHAVIPELEAQMPAAMQIMIPYDASEFIEASIKEVFLTLGQAIGIVLLVIFICLGSLRAALVPAVAVPLSLVGGAFLMLVMGFSINLLTLLAMVLSIGLVVDDAIVVVENVHRHIENGKSAFDAAIIGARELRLPIIAMTTTLVAVYAPIGFMGGLVGSLFIEFAFTLAGAVVISGIVALTLSPMLCAKVFKTSRHGWFERTVENSFAAFSRMYGAVLHRVLNFSSVIVVFGLTILVCIYYLFTMAQSELAPSEDQSIIYVSGRGPETATIEYTRHYAQQILEVYESIPEYKESFFMLGFGGSPNNLFGGFKMGPPHTRERAQSEIEPELQHKLASVAGLQVSAFPRPSLPGAGRGLPIQFVILSAADYAELDRVADELLDRALASHKFIFLQKAVEFSRPKTNIVLDRNRAGALGIDMEEIGRSLALFLGGNYVNWFNLDGRSYKVIPQVAREYRATHEMLQGYYVRSGEGLLIPLATLVSFESSVEPSDRTQFQQLNSLVLQGIPAPGVTMGDAIEYLNAEARNVLPQEYSWDYAGMARQYAQQGNTLVITFFVSLVIIYLVLAAQFESWRDPLVILMSVPMSIAGALAFIVWGFGTINIYTQLGLITLIGVITKNGILIVEFANRLQANEGLSKRAAIEQAAMIRLRPILMTSIAMIVAMVPLLSADGPGAASRFQMGLVITTGLGIGTIFTLFVVPAYYLFIARDHRATVRHSEAIAATDEHRAIGS
ncbi:MAG: multidrug efflux protein [Proteobacteria bacterium]|nr:MAG: multidrug efflux protein [Pseudomonadota bacterium]